MQSGYQGIESRGQGNAIQNVAVEHTQCRLGQWYDSEGKDLFGQQKSFKQINNPHQQVHENVKKAVEAAQGDWLHDDELLNAIVDAIKSAEHASAQVMNLLNSMVEEKHAHTMS